MSKTTILYKAELQAGRKKYQVAYVAKTERSARTQATKFFKEYGKGTIKVWDVSGFFPILIGVKEGKSWDTKPPQPPIDTDDIYNPRARFDYTGYSA